MAESVAQTPKNTALENLQAIYLYGLKTILAEMKKQTGKRRGLLYHTADPPPKIYLDHQWSMIRDFDKLPAME
ncbi:MAG: hypothetical protein HYT89_01640 [Candidatus Omnitrophica bacterium]|nr:hypothetical protein [Candidatus Omnitrophota bacterium]